jgi:hypothetical protein
MTFRVTKLVRMQGKKQPIPWLSFGCGLGLALCSLTARAGEKIEFSDGAKKLEGPKAATKELDDLPSLAPFSPKPQFDTMDQPIGPTLDPRVARKLQQKLEKEKNWIFNTPKDSESKFMDLEKFSKGKQKDEDSMFGGEDSRPAYQRYWEDHDAATRALAKTRDKRDDRDGRDSRDGRDENGRNDRTGNKWLMKEVQSENGPDSKTDPDAAPLADFNLRPFLNQDGEDQKASELSRRYEHSTFSIPIAQRAPLTADQRREVEADRKAHDAAFSALMQPRSITPSLTGVQDPINTGIDASRQEFNPIAPSRTQGLPRLGASEGPSIPSSPFGGASAARSFEIPRPSAFDSFGGRAATAPSISAADAGPIISPPRFTPAPAVLEMPRRKF